MLLPDDRKIVSLDQRREVLVSMAENVERATPAQRRALIELQVRRVEVARREVRTVTGTPAAVPFFEGCDHLALAD